MTNNLISQIRLDLDLVQDRVSLDGIRIKYLGKSGLISSELKKLGTLSGPEKIEFGKNINLIKDEANELLNSKLLIINQLEINAKLTSEFQDISLPARDYGYGKIHPISQATEELVQIFGDLGFSIEEGPSIEDNWHNFTALNMDENHPARQMHDTFYLKNENGEAKVLRTHTSNVQIRAMGELAQSIPFSRLNQSFEFEEPRTPSLYKNKCGTEVSKIHVDHLKMGNGIRFIAPGRTYRSDSDMTHTPMFHQIEGVFIDENVNMGHLKYMIDHLMKAFFEKDVEILFRPSFFPFTEPGAEIDIKMPGGTKWLEVGGCGMIHPNVLRNVNIDPEQYRGFAFGMGIDRLAMLKYNIKDLREMFEGDVNWLCHYGFEALDIPSLVRGLTK